MMTLNTIIRELGKIAKSHIQIKTVLYGNVNAALTEKKSDISYPLFAFQLFSTGVSGNKESFVFDIALVDRIDIDQYPQNVEVHSDMISISNDIISKVMDEDSYNWMVEGGVDRSLFDPVTRTPDCTEGIIMRLTISQIFKVTRCNVPGVFENRIFDNQFDIQFE